MPKRDIIYKTVQRYENRRSASGAASKTMQRSDRPSVESVTERVQAEQAVLGLNFKGGVTAKHIDTLRNWNLCDTIEEAMELTGLNRQTLNRHITRFRFLKMNVKRMSIDFKVILRTSQIIHRSHRVYLHKMKCSTVVFKYKTQVPSVCNRIVVVKRKNSGDFKVKCKGCGKIWHGTVTVPSEVA